MKRNLSYLVMTVTFMLGGYLLTSYAIDMSQMSVRAFGTRGQTLQGGPVISVASRFTGIRVLTVIVPALILAAWRVRWLTDTTCLLYFLTSGFALLTWTISVAYFSVQPGVLG